jgi:hypothetical protein
MLVPNPARPGKPVAVLGAGDLTSHLHRGGDPDDPANYRFSVFRLRRDLQATHELRPWDLHDMIKLCQILSFAIVDDGWVPKETSESLRGLFDQLDGLTRSWSNADDG